MTWAVVDVGDVHRCCLHDIAGMDLSKSRIQFHIIEPNNSIYYSDIICSESDKIYVATVDLRANHISG